MRQKATVVETKGEAGEIARVRVLRSSMCEGCEKRADGGSCACSALLGAQREMFAEADNAIGAVPGDDVEIETETSTVLLYGALVFLLPIVGAFVFYLVAEMLFSASSAPWVAAGIGLVLSFLPAVILDRINRKKTPRIRIVSIVGYDHNRMDESNADEK